MALLELNDVHVAFGEKTVLDGLNLQVAAGQIYGLIGQNGAGKTTTMKLILGLIKADRGGIAINGRAVHFGQAAANFGVGYLPDVPAFYDYLTASEYLRLCGQITKMAKAELAARIPEMLELVGLTTAKNRRIHGFSRGMKQRLGIAQALLNRPQLLICDEPTSALDPAGRSEFLNLLASLRGETTIVLSTHILSDVERICDHVGILHHGIIQKQGSLKSLLDEHAAPQIAVDFEDAAAAQLAANALGATLQNQRVLVPAAIGMPALLAKLTAAQLTPLAINPLRPHLEDVFMEAVS